MNMNVFAHFCPHQAQQQHQQQQLLLDCMRQSASNLGGNVNVNVNPMNPMNNVNLNVNQPMLQAAPTASQPMMQPPPPQQPPKKERVKKEKKPKPKKEPKKKPEGSDGEECTKRRKKKALSVEEKNIVLNVFNYVKQTWPIEDYPSKTNMIEKAALVMGIGKHTVNRVLREYHKKGKVSPPKKAKKRLTILEKTSETDKMRIKKIVQDFYARGDVPSLKKVQRVVNADETLPNFTLSTMHRLFKHLKIKTDPKNKVPAAGKPRKKKSEEVREKSPSPEPDSVSVFNPNMRVITENMFPYPKGVTNPKTLMEMYPYSKY